MPYYLEFDGIDDGFQTPSMQFNSIEVELLLEKKKADESYIASPPYIIVARSRSSDMVFGGTAYVNGVQSNTISSNQRVSIRLTTTNLLNAAVYFMSVQGGANAAKGKIWSIKFFDGPLLQAHYDFTLGNVQDTSGNGRHGGNNGATFVFEPGGNLEAPKLTIVNISTSTYDNTISGKPNMDRATVTFTFDQDVTEWRVRTVGADHKTGILADSGGAVKSGIEIIAEIDYTELYQEGQNRVNIYGKNADGQWTGYE